MAEKLDALEEAILNYYRQFGHLPCPASATEPENTATFGRATDCAAGAPAGTADSGVGSDAVRTGIVPTRTLSIADSAMFDPWGNRIAYTVIKDLAKDQAAFDAYPSPPTSTTGVIQIVDLNGNQVTNDDGNTIIAYALVSHGKNGDGAANRLGNIVTACNNATKDGENCNDDPVIRDTDIQDSTVIANYYDDIVRWKEMETLGTASVAASSTTPQFSMGDQHSCGLKSDGTGWCWGLNDYGQLGNGTIVSSVSPVQVTSLASVANLVTGNYIGCAVLTDRTAWCWGAAYSGDGSSTSNPTPVQVSGLTNVQEIIPSSGNVCAVKTDGTLWCWGINTDGNVGDGTGMDQATPVQIPSLTNALDVDVNTYHSCAVKSDGTVWCWGLNDFGQIGDNTTTNRLIPTQAIGITGVSKVAVARNHTCALKSDGTVWCWGANDRACFAGQCTGQLGDGTTTTRGIPGPVPGLTNVTQIAAADDSTCVIKSDSTVWCWGYNFYGQLGDNTTTNRLTPTQVSGGFTATSIYAAQVQACAGKSDGSIWCWGANADGNLGDGTTIDRHVPTKMTYFP